MRLSLKLRAKLKRLAVVMLFEMFARECAVNLILAVSLVASLEIVVVVPFTVLIFVKVFYHFEMVCDSLLICEAF